MTETTTKKILTISSRVQFTFSVEERNFLPGKRFLKHFIKKSFKIFYGGKNQSCHCIKGNWLQMERFSGRKMLFEHVNIVSSISHFLREVLKAQLSIIARFLVPREMRSSATSSVIKRRQK